MNPNTIREFAASFQKSRILLSSFELDIFTNVDESGTTNNQIANNLHLDEHACERLLNALVSLGFLKKQNHLFFNTAESFTFLSKKSSDYLGGLMHSNQLWKTWSNLTQVVKTGISAHPEELDERGEEWLFPFINAMHDRAKKQAPQQLANIDLSEIKSILDIGGGSGAYSMEFVTKKPEVETTVFDLPNVVPITKKCFNSLNKNGKIVIQDWIMNDDRTQPVSGAIFAINMLVGTEAGDCFTEQEVIEMLNTSGFKNVSRIEFETGLSQMIAQKI